MAKYVVTGGAGFIGSHLVEALSGDCDVVVIDNLHTGSPENLKGLPVELVVDRARAVSNVSNCECIFHLGIPSSSPMYKENPALVSAALEDWIAVLEHAKRTGAKVVLAGTSSVYNGNPLPYREDMPVYVKDFYTETRYTMERLGKLYSELYGVEVVVLRLFSVYGEKEEHKGRYANLVSQFTWAILKGERPVIYGDGTQTRDFIYVKDVVEAFLLAEKRSFSFEIFNVGTGKNYTLNQLVNMINEELNKDVKPVYVKNPIKNYVYHTLADTSKAEYKLGFKAKTTLKEGIRKVVEYYKKRFKTSLQ